MATSKGLSGLVQTLPQELYDKILQLVFEVNPGERVIGKDYRPPAQLQIDTASRALFAQVYYGNGSTFTFTRDVKLTWLRSLPLADFEKIACIRCPMPKYKGILSCQNVEEWVELEHKRADEFRSTLRSIGYHVSPQWHFNTTTLDLTLPGCAHARWESSLIEAVGEDTTFKKVHAAESKGK